MTHPVTRRGVLAGTAASAAVLAVSARPPWAGTATIHDVSIKAFTFDPDPIIAKPGDVIRWTNEDLAPHTATADEFSWDTEELAQGENAQITVTSDMELSYFCVFHPHMKGTIELA